MATGVRHVAPMTKEEKALYQAARFYAECPTEHGELDLKKAALAYAAERYKEQFKHPRDTKRKCDYCGKMTRVTTAGCDHCDVEDK